MKAVELTHVYAIQSGEDGPVKVGIATSASQRVRELQTGNPYKLRLLGYSVVRKEWALQWERKAHERLKDYRMEGEWFRVAPFVKQVAALIACGELQRAIDLKAPAETAKIRLQVPIRETATHKHDSLFEYWELKNPGLRVNHDPRVPLPGWVTGKTC